MSHVPDWDVDRPFDDSPDSVIPAPRPPSPESVSPLPAPVAGQFGNVVRHPSQPFPDLIPGIMPAGSLNLISGGSGVGKTAFIADWCVRFRDGRSICWKPTTIPVGGIGVIAGDRKWASHRQWFDAVGYPDIAHYSLRDDTSFNWESLFNRATLPKTFENAILRLNLRPGGLVVVDPISLFVAGNLIDFKQTAVSLAQLDKVCTRLGVTVLGIVHTAKQKGDKKDRYVRPQDRILGSTAFSGFTDTQMYLVGPEELDTEYYGFGWIPHHAPSEIFSFTRNPDTGLFVPYDHPSKDADINYIYGLITEDVKGTRTKEIVDACTDHIEVARTTLYTYLSLLQTRGKIEKVKHGCWRRTQAPLGTPPPLPEAP